MVIKFESEKPRRSRRIIDYLVVWRPRGGENREVIDTMKVVEAFSSSLPIGEVRATFEARDKREFRDLHGDGYVFVVEQGPGYPI
jgi:hypothetical protein